jgi:hypothetical protein
MRNTTTAIVACAALLVISVVSPAIGGPSIGSVAKTAKKALRTGKQAKRAASNAVSIATTASGKADQALARPAVTAGGITPVGVATTIPPTGFNAAAAICPGGQRVVSGGVVTNTGGGGTWADLASDDRTAWLGGGEDLSGTGGDLTVIAYCVPAGAVVASTDRAKIREEVEALKRSRAAR